MKLYFLIVLLFFSFNISANVNIFVFQISLESEKDNFYNDIFKPEPIEEDPEIIDERACDNSPVYCYLDRHGGGWEVISTRSELGYHTGFVSDFIGQSINQDAAIINAQSIIDNGTELYIQYGQNIEQYFIFDLNYLINGSCIQFSANTLFDDSIFFHESDNRCKATGTDYAYIGYRNNRTHTIVRHDFIDILVNSVGSAVQNESSFYRVREGDFVLMVR